MHNYHRCVRESTVNVDLPKLTTLTIGYNGVHGLLSRDTSLTMKSLCVTHR